MSTIILALISLALICKFASEIREILRALATIIKTPEK